MADPDYFTIAELNALPNMTDTKYTEARKLAAAAYITAIIEREVTTSFVAREKVETLDGGGRLGLMLATAYVRSLTTVTVGGVSVNVAKLTATDGILRYRDGVTIWPVGIANVVVTYDAGYSAEPPEDVKEQAIIGTRWHLLSTNSNADMDARKTKMTDGQGGTTEYAIAGKHRPTGYPTVDAMIVAWRDKLAVFGFA